jgi:signal transduction histidine kinase
MRQYNSFHEIYNLRPIILGLLFIIVNPILFAQHQANSCSLILLSSEYDHFSINKSVYYLEDAENTMIIDDMFKPEITHRFVQSTTNSLNFGSTRSTYWVRFCMKNPQTEINDWLLEIGYVHLDSINFYHFVRDTLISEEQLGDMFPFSQRAFDYRNFIIPLQYPDTTTHTYILRIRTQSSMQFPMTVYNEKAFIKQKTQDGMYNGIIVGMMIIIFIFNITGFFSLRDISHLYCGLIILSALLFISLMNGYFFQYFLPNTPWLNNHLIPFSIALLHFSILTFTRSFLKTKQYSALLDKVIIGFLIFMLIMMPLAFALSYSLVMTITNSVQLLYYMLYVVCAIVCSLKGNLAARLYIVSSVLFLIGSCALTFRTVGILPDNQFTAHSYEYTLVPYGLILFLALADRYKISTAEKEKAMEEVNLMQREVNVSLEQKVQERTEDLKKANIQLEEHQKELEEVNTLLEEQKEELMQQKEELQATLENLQKTQEQLVESEKMAAVGGLVAGVAHEINTPIGIGITAISNLQDDIQRMAALYEKDEISRKAFREFLQSSQNVTQLIRKNLERTASLVQSFKQVSADQVTEQQRIFALKEYLNDILVSLQPKFREKKIEFDIACDEELQLNSYPGVYAQIFTNLLLNSLQHGFYKKNTGTIGISAEIKDELLKIRYTDDGSGISKKDLPHIFEPFYTSDQHRGTGLGLNIIYNLVKQKLRGTITCESEPGKGVAFRMEMPVN